MHTSDFLALALLATTTSAHGVVTLIKGANGVNMPGLSVADGTPRDCATPFCGAEADTSIIRDREISSGKASPLGRTNGGGPVDPAKMIASFMGGSSGAAAASSSSANASAEAGKREIDPSLSFPPSRVTRALLGGLLGGAGGAGGGSGTKAAKGATETNVAAMAGTGATSGLPTCADDGTIEMVFHQVNQDGAGPLTAEVDGTSGGTDASAFKTAQVTQNVPGAGFGGLSLAAVTEFPLKVQMPAGMTCEGTVGGVKNVCIVRARNSALAGPFGGSAAFTQSAAAKKRALEYRMRKRAEEEAAAEYDA